MDEGLMEVWVEEIWLKYVREVSKQLGFDNSSLTFDVFSAHKTDDVQSKLVENKSDIFLGARPNVSRWTSASTSRSRQYCANVALITFQK